MIVRELFHDNNIVPMAEYHIHIVQGVNRLRSTAKLFSDIMKFNPYHDKLGRFTTSGRAASFTYRPGASVAHDRAIAREKERTKKVDKIVSETNKMAGVVVDMNGITTGKREAVKDIQAFYRETAMTNGLRWDAEKEKIVATHKAVDNMKSTARKIMSRQEYEDNSTSQEYHDLQHMVKKTPIKISDYDKKDIADWNDYRKSNFGNMTISQNGISIDSFYQELSSAFPHLFDSHRETSPSEQLQKINDTLQSLKPKKYRLSGKELDEAADNLALTMLRGYIDISRYAE
jgi:hypothetical protein